MTLGLQTTRSVGRAAKPLPEALNVRPLTPSDIHELETREAGHRAPPLERLSSRHHAIARALASGSSSGEAAMMVGVSASRVSILLADPTFKELVALYKKEIDTKYLELHDKMAGLAVDSANELMRRLEDDPDEVETSEIISVLKLTADRTGHAPVRKSEMNVNFNIGQRLEAARRRTAAPLPEPNDFIEAEVIEHDREDTSREKG